MTESQFHFDGKCRMEKILLENEWSLHIRDMEDYFPFLTDLGQRSYYPDLMMWKDGYGWVVFEVDGKKGHWTPRDLQKMRLRDEAFLNNDIRTVRIPTWDLVGKKKRSDADILEEIDYQLDMACLDYGLMMNRIVHTI